MALSINHATRVIFVPQADLTPLGGDRYELNVETFRLELHDYLDNVAGIPLPDPFRHNTVVVLSGIGYARIVEFINGYTIEFEDGMYQVNLVGGNHNIADVQVQNNVGLIVNNSAGLIQAGTGLTATESQMISDIYWRLGLDPAFPLISTPNAIESGDGSPASKRIDITGDGETITTLTRNDP